MKKVNDENMKKFNDQTIKDFICEEFVCETEFLEADHGMPRFVVLRNIVGEKMRDAEYVYVNNNTFVFYEKRITMDGETFKRTLDFSEDWIKYLEKNKDEALEQ